MRRLDDLIAPPKHHRPPTVAVSMANDPEVIRCIGRATKSGLARFILIGPAAKIQEVAKASNISVGDAEFIDEENDVKACAITALLAYENRAQIIMKGLVHTAVFTRAFLNKELGLVPEGNLVSHTALFDIESYHKLLLMTDGGINIDPDVPRKAAILSNVIALAHRIGIAKPKVALVSAIETINPKMRSTVDAQELVQMAEKGAFGSAVVDGPFGLDIAISAEAAHVKGNRSNVAGDADILLMPNIESGNVFYKTLTHFSSTKVAGMLSGARCPVIITSRSDTEEVKFRTLGLAVRSIAKGE